MGNQITTLITGATGLLGRWLVLECSKQGKRIGACMRRAETREHEYLEWIAQRGGNPDNVVCIPFDQTSDTHPWSSSEFAKVEFVYHTAAIFQFGLTKEEALRTNVEGGLRVVRWAASLPQVKRLVMVGGYRLTSPGLRYLRDKTTLSNKEIDALCHKHGAYEASKLVEYVSLREEARRLDLAYNVVHPSTVIGDSKSGETTQFLAFTETIKELYEGKMPALLGNKKTFLPLISVDYVASFMASIADAKNNEGEEYCLLDQDTPKLHALLHEIGRQLGVKTPGWSLPLWLVKRLPKSLLGDNHEGLSFLTEESYDTSLADKRAAELSLVKPPFHQTLQHWLQFLINSEFGTRKVKP